MYLLIMCTGFVVGGHQGRAAMWCTAVGLHVMVYQLRKMQHRTGGSSRVLHARAMTCAS